MHFLSVIVQSLWCLENEPLCLLNTKSLVGYIAILRQWQHLGFSMKDTGAILGLQIEVTKLGRAWEQNYPLVFLDGEA